MDPVAFEPVATETKTIRIGLLGCGNVGAALVQLVARQADRSRRGPASGSRSRGSRSATCRERDVDLADGVLTHDTHGVVVDPDVDLVVEVIGGIEPARGLIVSALRAGKPVVTADKELLANVGTELFATADDATSTCCSRLPSPVASRSSGCCGRACGASRSTA